MAAPIRVELANSPCFATTSRTPRNLEAVPSSSTRNADNIPLVASSSVTIRSSGAWPSSHACRDPSWCSIIPTIGRRARFFRCADRLFATRTRPARCNATFRHRVAQCVVVPLHQLLVEMLHREARILVPIETKHPLDLLIRRTLGRGLAQPKIVQAALPTLAVAFRPPLERPHVDTEHTSGLLLRDLAGLLPLQQPRKPHPTNAFVTYRRVHRAPFVQGTLEHDNSRAATCRAPWHADCGATAPGPHVPIDRAGQDRERTRCRFDLVM